ncbi:hypothetical protein BDB01DRAFT_802226 [Pilobolus umbonatus]|nr:hypothetical protein BDB01DRAFT_802226 [Pilobolus umbonatus]
MGEEKRDIIKNEEIHSVCVHLNELVFNISRGAHTTLTRLRSISYRYLQMSIQTNPPTCQSTCLCR